MTQLEKYTLLKKWEGEAQEIIADVCRFYDLPQKLVLSKSRKTKLVEARQLACYIMRKRFYKEIVDDVGRVKLLKLTTTDIGGFLGIDHATVMYAVKIIEGLLEVSKTYKEETLVIINKWTNDNDTTH